MYVHICKYNCAVNICLCIENISKTVLFNFVINVRILLRLNLNTRFFGLFVKIKYFSRSKQMS